MQNTAGVRCGQREKFATIGGHCNWKLQQGWGFQMPRC